MESKKQRANRFDMNTDGKFTWSKNGKEFASCFIQPMHIPASGLARQAALAGFETTLTRFARTISADLSAKEATARLQAEARRMQDSGELYAPTSRGGFKRKELRAAPKGMLEHMVSTASGQGKTPEEIVSLAAMLGMSLTVEQVQAILDKLA